MEQTGFPGGRRGGPLMRDWTQGSIVGNLLRLSWPMVISNSLMMLGPTIDMIWVGKLGSAAIAGVGVAGAGAAWAAQRGPGHTFTVTQPPLRVTVT